jgi:hypothetical protein
MGQSRCFDEKEHCVFMDEDGTWLPLRWGGQTGASVMGRKEVSS